MLVYDYTDPLIIIFNDNDQKFTAQEIAKFGEVCKIWKEVSDKILDKNSEKDKWIQQLQARTDQVSRLGKKKSSLKAKKFKASAEKALFAPLFAVTAPIGIGAASIAGFTTATLNLAINSQIPTSAVMGGVFLASTLFTPALYIESANEYDSVKEALNRVNSEIEDLKSRKADPYKIDKMSQYKKYG